MKYNPNYVYVLQSKNTGEVVVINCEDEKYLVINAVGYEFLYEPQTNSPFAQELKRTGKVIGYEIIQEWK